MKVGQKLLLSSVVAALTFIFVGLLALYDVNRIGGEVERVYKQDFHPMDEIDELMRKLLMQRITLFKHIFSPDIERMKTLHKEIDQLEDEIKTLLNRRDSYHLTLEEEKLFLTFSANTGSMFEGYRKILGISEGSLKVDAYQRAMTESQKLFDDNMEIIRKVHLMKQASADAGYKTSLRIKRNAWMLVLFVVMGGISLVIVVFFLTSRSATRTITEAVNTISVSSTEISSTVEQHERTASQQAASVNETTTTIDELGAASRQSAEQADSVAAMAKGALSTTEEGVKMARQASDGMGKMKEKMEGIGEQILHLSEQTGQIGKITTMVTDISGQINMLALNAAVEAVRAGEQGKGFAVIAQEIRKLADQGKKSAEQANAIVTDIQKATNSAVMVTEEGTKTAQEVAEIASRTGVSFASISGVVSSVYENVQQVSLNSKQQVAAIKQVVEAMNNVNAGAKETAAGISQTKIGIQRLNEAAQRLKGMV